MAYKSTPEQRRRWFEKYRDKNHEKMKERCRDYAKANRKKKNLAMKTWRKNNPEKAQAADDRHKEYRKRWCLENKDQLRLRQKEWRERNKHKIRAASSQRRHALLMATPKWLTEEQRNVMYAVYKSALVAQEFHEIPFHVDHIEPLRGKTSWGLHVPWNLQVLPAADNVRKSNKLIIEST